MPDGRGLVRRGGAEVTLRLPPPLESPLDIRWDDHRLLLEDGHSVVAEAVSADPGVTAPVPPEPAEAEAASAGIGAWGPPAFDECFVCGMRHDGSGHHRAWPPRSGGGWLLDAVLDGVADELLLTVEVELS